MLLQYGHMTDNTCITDNTGKSPHINVHCNYSHQPLCMQHLRLTLLCFITTTAKEDVILAKTCVTMSDL